MIPDKVLDCVYIYVMKHYLLREVKFFSFKKLYYEIFTVVIKTEIENKLMREEE